MLNIFVWINYDIVCLLALASVDLNKSSMFNFFLTQKSFSLHT